MSRLREQDPAHVQVLRFKGCEVILFRLSKIPVPVNHPLEMPLDLSPVQPFLNVIAIPADQHSAGRIVDKAPGTVEKGMAASACPVFLLQVIRACLRIPFRFEQNDDPALSPGESRTGGKNVLDLYVINKKSGEFFALHRFIDAFYLFLFCREQVQCQLLISSAVTISSACARRLFICLTQPI